MGERIPELTDWFRFDVHVVQSIDPLDVRATSVEEGIWMYCKVDDADCTSDPTVVFPV